MNIFYKVDSQRLSRVDNNYIVENSKQYLCASFTFSEDWDGIVKKVFFENGDIKKYVLLDGDDTICVVPNDIIKYPRFSIYVIGYGEDKTITTNVLKYNYVDKTGDEEGEIGGIGDVAVPPDANFIKNLISSDNTINIDNLGENVFDIRIPNIYFTRVKKVENEVNFYGRPIIQENEEESQEESIEVVLGSFSLNQSGVKDVTYDIEKSIITISYFEKDDLEIHLKDCNEVVELSYVDNILTLTLKDGTTKEVEIKSGGFADLATIEEARKYLGIGVD